MKKNLKNWSIGISMIFPTSLSAATSGSPAYDLTINIILCTVFVGMLLLVIKLVVDLNALKTATKHSKEKGATWINRNLYDFDEKQLKTLIRKINKSENNDKQVDAAN